VIRIIKRKLSIYYSNASFYDFNSTS